MPSLQKNGAKIFLSYAHADKDVVQQINSALVSAGLESWLDVLELNPGDQLLEKITEGIKKDAYCAIVLSRKALDSKWVRKEIDMALTSKINNGYPEVLVLRLDVNDYAMPIELGDVVSVDFRGRFDAAITELVDHVKGIPRSIGTPKQTILAQMIKTADAELWARLCEGPASPDEWAQNEVADVIRGLRSDELEAAIRVGSLWSGHNWQRPLESELIDVIRHATNASDAVARRILKSLDAGGFLHESINVEHGTQSESTWCDGSILWIVRRAARRSGLFLPVLPPPLPERLSSLLAYEKPMEISSHGLWYAMRFPEPLLTALHATETGVVAVSSQDKLAGTWVFRSPNDRSPLKADRFFVIPEITPANPLWTTELDWEDHERVGFDLATFDDLELLRG